MIVFATREGLVGDTTASGFIIDRLTPFVALPSTKALRRAVRVSNPATGRAATALVLDVGPHNIHDDLYVLNGARPRVESGAKDDFGRQPPNHAGIDLGEWVWAVLGYRDNGPCEWWFLD